MALAAGTRLGPYEIHSLVGVGGMGEVYKARDTQLQREVALKILPSELALDAERLARFEREAHALAALNHPHIAQVYGFAHDGDVRAIVMELVEGPTLADRIAGGPVSADEVLPIAIQFADALEYAHERGVVHRDLKPANIKLTPDGAVKILDFGLAKVLANDGPGQPADLLANSPTMTSPAMSRVGVVLGTAAYMAPEQARGATVDKRADIWAFGVVLFELLTGKACFAGETVTDVLAAVVKSEPHWSALPLSTPWRLHELLHRCLAKDRRQRLHDVGDARLELEKIAAGDDREALRVDHVARRWKIVSLSVGLLALGACVGLLLSFTQAHTAPQQTSPLRLSILHDASSEVGVGVISPDGRRVVYRARGADGMPRLWVREIDSFEPKPLDGTVDANNPFWSADSRQIGFATADTIKRVSASGGPIAEVVRRTMTMGATWAPDDTIVFAKADYGLFRVPAGGGESKLVSKPLSPDWSHYWPCFLPDGRRFLFHARLWTRSAEASNQGIYLGSLDKPGQTKRLLPDLSSAVFAAPGYVVFARNGTLTAAPFDLTTEKVGEPLSLGILVAQDGGFHLAAISAASDGVLAVRPKPAVALYTATAPLSPTELRLVDRTGKMTTAAEADWYFHQLALAPDNIHAVVAVADPREGTSDLWLVDLATGSRTRLTTTHGFGGSPVFSNDGTRLAWAYQPPGRADDVYVRDLRTGKDTPVIESENILEHPMAWSHDGAYLLFFRSSGAGQGLWTWSFTSKMSKLFVETLGRQRAAFSPNDRYVAFSSAETGRYEVSVTTFPERTQTWPLTTQGGQVVSWRRDGREILVATLSGDIVAYPVTTDGGFRQTGAPTTLIANVGIGAPFSDANRDHSKILVRIDPDRDKDKGEIRLLYGWADKLKTK